jgi:hypothetical protein
MGRSLLASHGIHVTGKWWKGKTWRAIQAEGLQSQGKIPRGVGPLTFEVLRREVGDWSRFTSHLSDRGRGTAADGRSVAPVHRSDHGGEAGADLSAGGGRGFTGADQSQSYDNKMLSHEPLTLN